jgi:asparagine synthetase B (glutamine-hydrolysing)
MKNTDKKHVPRSYDLDPVEVTSTARVLLLGTGADEQMGGYGRHRKAYNDPPSGSTGAQHLAAELKLDFERLWVRNLGRDDRVISDHGKEARFPFLDEDVVHLLSCRDGDTNGNGSLPLDLICDMTLPPGVGDKRILRLVAQSLGVQICSSLVKRAIQFGSRIAKINGEREFGSKNRGYGTARHGCFSPPSN